MQPESVCRRCGAALPPDGAPCPRCLLELGVAAPPPADEEPATSAPSARMVPPGIDELRELFPDLELESLIGHGGMGAVFRARQKKLQRDVALKVLPRELSADRAFADRFLREARALARLSHPNIVAVHDYGETGGICWLMLEYVDGVNLRGVLRAGSLSPRQALAIVRELCDALQYAHDEGVVHRDIKPENVLVDRRGRAKVADFGLAKLVGAPADADLTREGQVMGTPHYMAPEQIERPRDVDHRADIYALGVVFYEMLTGSLPRGNFEPPSRRVQVDVRLDEIVLKALEHEPSRRYQHAVDVKTDVDSVGDSARTASESAATEAKRDPPEGFGLHVEFGRPGVNVRTLEWPRARGDASRERDGAGNTVAPRIRVDVLRGWRGFVFTVVLWVALGFAWNAGPFVYAAALLAAVVAYGTRIRSRLRAAPEFADALDSERAGRRTVRVTGALLSGLLGLALVTFGHLAIWERGVATWTPEYRLVDEAMENLSGGLSALLPSSRMVVTDGDPRLRVVRAEHTLAWSEIGMLWGRNSVAPLLGWFAIAVGLLVLAVAVWSTIPRRASATPWSAPWIIAGELGATIALALGAGWIAVPLATLERSVELEAVSKSFELDVPVIDTPFDERSPAGWSPAWNTCGGCERALRIAAARAGLRVDIAQLATVRGFNPSAYYADVLVARTAADSPFDRWRLGWTGPRRTTPAIWAIFKRVDDMHLTRVELRAGLYTPGSSEAEIATEALRSIESDLVGAQGSEAR